MVRRRYILSQYQTRSERKALFAIVDAHIMQAKTANRADAESFDKFDNPMRDDRGTSSDETEAET